MWVMVPPVQGVLFRGFPGSFSGLGDIQCPSGLGDFPAGSLDLGDFLGKVVQNSE